MTPKQLETYLNCLDRAQIGDRVEFYRSAQVSSLSDLLASGAFCASLDMSMSRYQSAVIVGKTARIFPAITTPGWQSRTNTTSRFLLQVKGQESFLGAYSIDFIQSRYTDFDDYSLNSELIAKLASTHQYCFFLGDFRFEAICRIYKANPSPSF